MLQEQDPARAASTRGRGRWREAVLIVAVLAVAAAVLLRKRLRDDVRVIDRIDTTRTESHDTVRLRR
jgi:hypothetical protein